MSSILKNLIFLILILAVGGLGYYLYTQDNFAVLDLRQDTQTANNLEQETAGFVSRLRMLQQVELQTDVFTDPHFTSLESFTTPVPERTIGRDNPYEPVSGI